MIDPTVLRQLCEQATPGPLSVVNDNEGMDHGPLWKVVSPDPSPDDEPYFEAIVYYGVKADADLYAAAREALPQLLDENAALREKVTKAEAERDTFSAHVDRVEDENTALESRLAALKAVGEKVVDVAIQADPLFLTVKQKEAVTAFKVLLRSDPWQNALDLVTPAAKVRALESRLAALKEAVFVVEAVEWSHPSNDIPEGSTRITIKGVIQPVGAGDTIRYLRGTP